MEERIDPLELGIPNINFSIKGDPQRLEKYKEQRLERGFDDTETWALDETIALFILPRLKRFKEVCCVYPSNLGNHEEWGKILDTMIEAFEALSEGKREEEIIREGLSNFAKWYTHLWW